MTPKRGGSSVNDAPWIGDVLLARLPTHAPPGHEQQGLRPVLVVADPSRVGTPRYAVVFAAPLTSQHFAWRRIDSSLYPLLKRGVGGLTQDSAVLLEHARGIDAARVVRRLGTLSADEYAPIRKGLEQMFDFGV